MSNLGIVDEQSKKRFFESVKDILPAASILNKLAECKPYEYDALPAFKQVPQFVLLPESIQQVQKLVALCSELQVPIVSRGAGTGLSGGATPHPNGVVISLSKMNKVLEIDADNKRIRVEPGISNLEVSNRVKHLGLFYAPDPSSQIVSTIGGNIAENSGGVHCVKYGLTIHNVLEADVVLTDGTLVTLTQNNGLDLLALITGSEGMLGIVVSAWLKLLDLPGKVKVLVAGFPSLEKASDAVAKTMASGIVPAGMEMMDEHMVRLIERHVNAGYPTGCEAVLLCELDGYDLDLDRQLEIVKNIFESCDAQQLQESKDSKDRERMWKGRKSAFPAVGKEAPDYYSIDGTVPRKHLGDALRAIVQLGKEYGLRVYNVFHAGDGNLHPLILYDASKGEMPKAQELGDAILSTCIKFGGTITGEHGVGLEKLNGMCEQFTTEELEQFHALRKAFDPGGIMNPGKAIPTLARCAEWGGMHVHKGNIPFPNLERF